jgi:hypothetical protein
MTDEPQAVTEPEPNPDDRLKPGATGTRYPIGPAELLLPEFVPEFAECWDRVYDGRFLAGSYDAADLRACVMHLVLVNYDVSLDEALGAAVLAHPDELVAPVEAALYSPPEGARARTWSRWARASLIAGGIRPDTVHPADLQDVLDVLVMTGRTVPPERFVGSAYYRAERDALDAATAKP